MAAPPSARVWVTTPDGAVKMSDRGTVEFRPGGSERADDHRRPEPRATSAWTASAPRSPTPRPRVLYRLDRRHARRRRCATCSARRRRRPVVPAPADGRLGLRRRRRTTPTTTCRPGRPTTRCATSRSRTTASRSCRCCARRSALNPQLKVIATPWSPPAWMKTNDSLIGGRLIDDPRIYDAYARYFVKFVQAYAARRRAGLRAHACRTSRRTATRTATRARTCRSRQEAKLIEALGPDAARARACSTKILGYDHNWSEHPERRRHHAARRGPRDRVPVRPARSARRRAGSPAPRSTATPATRAAQTDAARRVPGQGRSGSPSAPARTAPTDPPAQVFSRHAQVARPQPRARRHPQLGQDRRQLEPRARPVRRPAQRRLRHLHRRASPSAPATPSPANAEYYTLGHLARFVQPGAVRIASTSFGTTGWNGQIMDVAFRNPRRLDRARRAQRERRPAHASPSPQGGAVVRLHAARRRAGHVHLAAVARARRRPASCSTPTDDRHRRARRRRGQRGRRRRHHALDDRRRAAAGPVAPGRPRPRAARPPGRRSTPAPTRRLPARLRALHEHRRVELDDAGAPAPAPASSPPSTSRRRARATCASSRPRTAPQWWTVADLRIYR